MKAPGIISLILFMVLSAGGFALSSDSLSKLKAVLVVGPTEESTSSAIDKKKEIALYLRSLGINVKEFYDTKANWAEIIKEAEGASLFLYSGHGTTLGENGSAGGLCLAKERVSSNSILKELKLHKNALVLFESVCMGAGSSASDNSDIGIKEAVQRVSDYSNPFFKMGAGAYFASNSSGSSIKFLKSFFNNKSIRQIYEEALSSFYNIETTQKYIYDQKLEISVASSNWGGVSTRTTYTNGVKKIEQVDSFKNYDIAFVSRPGFTVKDLFK